MPSANFIRPYEKLKEENQARLYTEFRDSMWAKVEDKMSGAKARHEELKALAVQVLESKENFLNRAGDISPTKIANVFGTYHERAVKIRDLAVTLGAD
jgi:hypothetical protein